MSSINAVRRGNNLVHWQGTSLHFIWSSLTIDSVSAEGSTVGSDQLVQTTGHRLKCKARTACVFWQSMFRRSYVESFGPIEYEFIIIIRKTQKQLVFFYGSTFLAFINIKSSKIWQFYVPFVAVNVFGDKRHGSEFIIVNILYWVSLKGVCVPPQQIKLEGSWIPALWNKFSLR